MTAAESHSIRIGIIIGVVSALIASAILSVVGPLAEPLAAWVWKPLASFVVSASLAIWVGVTYRVPIPAWLLAALVVGCIVAVIPYLRRGKGEQGPTKHDYLTDMFQGVRWRWEPVASLNPFVMEPFAFCPKDDTQLVVDHGPYHGSGIFRLVCETCGDRWGPFDGDSRSQRDAIRRQIDRKLRTGEWREAVERERSSP